MRHRHVLYLILILLKNQFDKILCMFTLKLIFHDLKAKTLVYFFMPQTILQNQGFLKKKLCEFIVKSQKLFKLQKRVTSNFNSLEKLI